jgi:tetratricopeptide (TPR) repeat protein
LHESSKNWHRYLYGGIILLDTIVLYYTATRGAVLGLVGGMFVVAVYLALKERENKFYRKLSYGLLTLVALIVLGFFAIRNTDFAKSSPVLGRFRTMGISEIKTQGRYYVWPMAIKGFEEKPILGWGQEGFNYVFNKYYNPGMFGQEEWFDRSHNVFLDWLIAGGLLGFLAYLSLYISFLYYVLYKGRSTRVSDRAIMLGMICAYVFHNIFVFDNLISYIMFFSVLAFVHTLYGEDLGGLDYYKSKNYSWDSISYVVLPSVTVLLLISLYFVNYPAYSANKTLIRAISPQGNLSKNLDYFKDAFGYNSFGNDEIVEQLVQAASNLPKNADPKVIGDFQSFAEEKITAKISKTPHDTRYLVFAGSYYNSIGKFDVALDYLKKALVESPNKQSILIQIGSNYLVRGDTNTMMEYFRKAYDLKPSYIESVKILAIGAIYSKDIKTLQELSSKLDSSVIVNDDRFLRAYIGINNYDAALSIVSERLKNDPKNIQNNFTLAGLYVTIGQKQKAVEVLNKVSQDHPEYKSEIDNYIKQIQQ